MSGAAFYDADTGDRIVAALEHLEIPARDRLAAAAGWLDGSSNDRCLSSLVMWRADE